MKRTRLLPALLLTLAGAAAAAAAPAPDAPAGLMQGFPPPPEMRVLRSNFMEAPRNRWAFQHIRELQPTREIWRGEGPVSPLPREPLELGGVTAPAEGGGTTTLDALLENSYTDAFLVLHEGRIVFERYMNGMQPHRQHQMFSATKSFVGTVMLMLIHEGLVDPSKPVAHYVPELRASAFGDATVQQVLNMTTGVRYTEIYDDPKSDIWRYGWVFGVWGAPPAGYDGPMTIYDYLPTLPKEGEHGKAFHYVTPNTDVLGWIIRRVSGKSVDRHIEERFWQPMGAERDAYIWLDGEGSEMAGGGLNITARDAARFGWMLVDGGRAGGRQVVPKPVVERIFAQGDREAFLAYYGTLGEEGRWYSEIGHSYHDQWWSVSNAHRGVLAVGVHGQHIYLDPVARMVVVKQSSSPEADGNVPNDFDAMRMYQALGEHLMKRGGAPISGGAR